MPTVYVPFGKLVSFGAIIFSGGSPLSPAQLNSMPTMQLDWDVKLQEQQNSDYPYDLGYGKARLKDPRVTWIYLLRSTSSTEAAAWTDLQTQFNTLIDDLEGTHTLDGYTSASGQVADLVVKTPDGTGTLTGRARIVSAHGDPKPGQITALEVSLTFALLGRFS
jgi:hypothetical protein